MMYDLGISVVVSFISSDENSRNLRHGVMLHPILPLCLMSEELRTMGASNQREYFQHEHFLEGYPIIKMPKHPLSKNSKDIHNRLSDWSSIFSAY